MMRTVSNEANLYLSEVFSPANESEVIRVFHALDSIAEIRVSQGTIVLEKN